MKRRFMVLFLPLIATACDESSAPTGPTGKHPIYFAVHCQIPTTPTVQCEAYLFNRLRDGSTENVTSAAQWIASPPGLASFTTPGILTPNGRGEVSVIVNYERFTNSTPSIFLVDPNETARWIFERLFSAVETDGATVIGGVNITITSGYRSGASCVTNPVSGSCVIDRLLTYEEFTGVASKTGYQTTTFTRTASPPVGVGLPFPPIQLARSQVP